MQICHSLSRSIDNVTVINGFAGDRVLLLEENIENVDVFCALDGDDEDNIISSLQAKYLGVGTAMSIIINAEYKDLFGKSAIDVLLLGHQLVISYILTNIRQDFINTIYILASGKSQIIEVDLTNANS